MIFSKLKALCRSWIPINYLKAKKDLQFIGPRELQIRELTTSIRELGIIFFRIRSRKNSVCESNTQNSNFLHSIKDLRRYLHSLSLTMLVERFPTDECNTNTNKVKWILDVGWKFGSHFELHTFRKYSKSFAL